MITCNRETESTDREKHTSAQSQKKIFKTSENKSNLTGITVLQYRVNTDLKCELSSVIMEG